MFLEIKKFKKILNKRILLEIYFLNQISEIRIQGYRQADFNPVFLFENAKGTNFSDYELLMKYKNFI
jgi:hypothetical protein